ncbi:amidohydrolase family protein [Mycobacterium sp.]|uniref:amidohydrolase family protein n=1 Tax=Mycobacterium sp. TaxID=1785 RepID=UPI003C75771F
MKVIGFEEHYPLPAISEASPNEAFKFGIDILKEASCGDTDPQGQRPTSICDLGEGRIAAMDAAGIDMQILSHSVSGSQTVEPALAVQLAEQADDTVAAAVTKHPDQFRGFATLPMRDPAAAARELERTARDWVFVAALIDGHIDGRYLDDKFFWPLFECAETLGVPIYLHPTVPPKPLLEKTPMFNSIR